jgi:hypothetical protein
LAAGFALLLGTGRDAAAAPTATVTDTNIDTSIDTIKELPG